MGLIYKLAYRVVVWLGPQSDDSARALATLDYIGAQVEIDRNDGSVGIAPFAEEPTWCRTNSALPHAYRQHTWNAVLELLLRPWFRRVWTVQEVQLGSKRPGPIFHCGMETISLSKLYRAVRCLDVRSRYPSSNLIAPDLANELKNAVTVLQPMVGRVFLYVLQSGTMGRQCKDGRDKIYGTLSLLPKLFASKIKVDYRRSNTASQVYKTAFLTHAEHVERLELFASCRATGRTIADEPTWVPDWGSHPVAQSHHIPQFATSTSRAHFGYCEEEPDLLEVLGVSCAVVSHVSDPLPKSLDKQDFVERVRQWQPRDLDTAIYKPTEEPLRKAYACTLIENTVAERFHGYSHPSIEKWAKQAGDLPMFGDFTRSPGGLEAGDAVKMDLALSRASHYCGGHAFIQAHEGYIGLAPPETRPGDVVAIFLGCSKPLVLRPGQGRYSIVGESFIYGLGDAIKLLGPLPEPWRVMTSWAGNTSDRQLLHFYFNSRTRETSWEDPRLEPLRGWKRIGRAPDGDDPIEFDFFKHEETGIVVNYDPRLEPEMLEKRGVQLEWFDLV